MAVFPEGYEEQALANATKALHVHQMGLADDLPFSTSLARSADREIPRRLRPSSVTRSSWRHTGRVEDYLLGPNAARVVRHAVLSAGGPRLTDCGTATAKRKSCAASRIMVFCIVFDLFDGE